MDRKHRILVVDDDENIADLVGIYLEKEGFEVEKAYEGKTALKAFELYAPDLVVLDIMLPGMDGYEICREIRKMSEIPVIFLTAKGETFDKVLGLELGGDDYMVKPFDGKELAARVKAVLRRYKGKEVDDKKLVYPNLTIDMGAYLIIHNGKSIDIPPKEIELLYFLASNPNRTFTREQLLDKVWGYEYLGDTRTIDVHIKRIREKFGDENQWQIKTVWGVGYKFVI